MSDKRYIATIQVYVHAQTDKCAAVFADDLAKKLRSVDDNYAEVLEIFEQPFGKLTNRKIEHKV